MPLQLIITDPHNLTEQERMAVLTFCGVRVETRDATKIAGTRNEPRDTVREVIAAELTAGTGKRAEPITVDDGAGSVARGEVRIDPLDDPSCGAVPVPPVPGSVNALAVTVEPPAPDTRDYSSLFGGAPAAPSVPIPPAPTPPAVPAVPSAASAPAAASVPSAGGSDAALPPAAPPNPSNALDSAGMPWDHRIHATTKTKNGDGTWRAKRGVAEKLVADVVEQNKRLMAIAPPAIPTAPAVPAAAVANGATPPIPPAADGMTFAELMEQVIRLINSGKVSIEAANASCMPIGVTALHQLDKRPDLIPAAWAHIKQAAGVQ